jgi:hypothetical protein
MDRDQNLTQAIDIWSLGCVFSVAATWLARGSDAIQEYKDFRAYSVDQYLKKHPDGHLTNRRPLTRGDYFHNGESVLSGVISWHQFLRSCLRDGDTWTSQVLDIVENRMFETEPGKRISAKQFYQELKALVEPKLPVSPLPLSIQSWYQKRQAEATNIQLDETMQDHPKLDAEKSARRLQIHRLQYTTSNNFQNIIPSPPPGTPPGTNISTNVSNKNSYQIDSPEIKTPRNPRSVDYSNLDPLDEQEELRSQASFSVMNESTKDYTPSEAVSVRRERTRQPLGRPENPWQAIGNLRREASSNNGLLTQWFGTRQRDERLKSWFENRDIVSLVTRSILVIALTV